MKIILYSHSIYLKRMCKMSKRTSTAIVFRWYRLRFFQLPKYVQKVLCFVLLTWVNALFVSLFYIRLHILNIIISSIQFSAVKFINFEVQFKWLTVNWLCTTLCCTYACQLAFFLTFPPLVQLHYRCYTSISISEAFHCTSRHTVMHCQLFAGTLKFTFANILLINFIKIYGFFS